MVGFERQKQMLIKLYYAKDALLEAPTNEGFNLKKIFALLKTLENESVEFQIIETNTLSDETLYKIYMEACRPAVQKKFVIRRMFGSKRKSASFFGRGVPALLVYNGDNQHPIDVYPHEEDGRLVTIREFLEKFNEKDFTLPQVKALHAAKRMDMRRRNIGPIEFKVAEFIHEGRNLA